jgi:toluene monooxygenase system ferredoxin subunit
MIAVIPTTGLWDGEMVGLRVDGVPVLIVNTGGVFRAYRDACAHLGVPLSQGTLEGTTLTCRAHCWTYDVTTGGGVNPPVACLRKVRLEVRDGYVFVDPHGGPS